MGRFTGKKCRHTAIYIFPILIFIYTTMQIRSISFQYNNSTIALNVNKSTFLDELYIDCRLTTTLNGAQRLQIHLHPKQAITIKAMEVQFAFDYKPTDSLFCNGWQSWTESREYAVDERIAPPLFGTKMLFEPMGDYGFYDYPNQKGLLHSWTYTYVKRNAQNYHFMGSANEQTGFTLFEHNTQNQTITVKKDLTDLVLEHSFPILDIIWVSNTESTVFDTFFDLSEIKKPTAAAPLLGWTSWYNYYTKISESIILENAKNVLSRYTNDEERAEIMVQTDDGWQTAVGDWHSIDTQKFPNGMHSVATRINALGGRAGLWLAPFICEKKSEIYRNKPQWILRDRKGKMVKAGVNPLWSGVFYALDFYNDEVQQYIRQILQTITYKWGFSLLKLDFLYAVCLVPPANKTRGQVMHEAMDFIRGIIPQTQILACGIPLAAAFGRVDYCRIGADTHLSWEHFWLALARNRERVSTLLALRNTVGRRQLDGRAFRNDPDVFILRKHNHSLTPAQQDTLLFLNVLLGSVWFLSDDLTAMDDHTRTRHDSLQHLKHRKIISVTTHFDTIKIIFEINNKKYTCTADLTAGTACII
jgi:alpha-galactosidase